MTLNESGVISGFMSFSNIKKYFTGYLIMMYICVLEKLLFIEKNP